MRDSNRFNFFDQFQDGINQIQKSWDTNPMPQTRALYMKQILKMEESIGQSLKSHNHLILASHLCQQSFVNKLEKLNNPVLLLKFSNKLYSKKKSAQSL